MEFQCLAPNCVVVSCSNGTRVLYSYAAPAAAYIPGEGYIKSERYFSRQTSSHVVQFARGNAVRTVTHDALLKIAKEVC